MFRGNYRINTSNIMSDKQWMNHAMKGWGSAHDEAPKSRVQRILREFKIYVVFDETIFIEKTTGKWSTDHPKGYESMQAVWRDYHTPIADVFSREKGLVVELDGDFHTSSDIQSKKPKRKRDAYYSTDLKFISFVTKEFLKMSDEEIRQKLLSII